MINKIKTTYNSLSTRIKIIIAASLLVLAGFYFFFLRNLGVSEISLLRGTPMDAAFVIQAKDFSQLLGHADPSNNIWKTLLPLPDTKELARDIALIKAVTDKNDDLEDLLDGKEIQISAHPLKNRETAYLFEIAIPRASEFSAIRSALNDWTDKHYPVKKSSVEGITVRQVDFKNESVSYAFAKGRAIFSFSAELCQKAVEQVYSETYFNQEPSLQRVIGTAGKNSQISLFVNYQNLGGLLSMYVDRDFLNLKPLLERFGEWSQFDVNVKQDALLFNGFTAADSLQQHFMGVFANQQAVRTRMEAMLPQTTAAFYLLSLSDVQKFRDAYKRFMENTEIYSTYLEKVARIKESISLDPEEFVYANLKSEMVMVFTKPEKDLGENNSLIIMDIKDPEGVKAVMMKVLENQAKKEGKSLNELSTSYQASAKKSFKIYNWPGNNLLATVAGDMFKAAQTNYFAFYGDYLVWGNSVNAISLYINEIETQHNLENDAVYNDFAGSLASESNILVYVNPLLATSSVTSFLKRVKADQFRKNSSVFGKIEGFAAQFAAEKDLLRSNLLIKTSGTNARQVQTVWECKLEGDIESKPNIVTNHLTGEKEILVQDSKDKIYLINSVGKILWSKKISDRIVSQVYQIDFMANGKFQYMFSTEKAIYLMDRNGNFVAPYPIKFKVPATNGISVFDYDNNKNYRILFANENKRVVALNKSGKLLEDWLFKETEGTVTGEIQHLRHSGNDYICFSDDIKNYFLNRKGESRIKPTKAIVKAPNSSYYYSRGDKSDKPCIFYTNEDGSIIGQYFTNETEQVLKNNFTANHFYLFADLNANNSPEHIIVSDNKLEIFDKNYKPVVSGKFGGEVVNRPRLFPFSGNKQKIGVTADDKIYLVNNDGQFFRGFPLKGSTSFSLGYFSKSSRKFSVIVGNGSNSVICYEVN
jgi:hypothetical protein